MSFVQPDFRTPRVDFLPGISLLKRTTRTDLRVALGRQAVFWLIKSNKGANKSLHPCCNGVDLSGSVQR